jgi:4'-phosphopantetheinyl transferase
MFGAVEYFVPQTTSVSIEFTFRSPACVHVWRANIGHTMSGLPDILSPDEQERASRYRNPEVRRRFEMGRATLRQLLGRYMRCPPGGLRFGQNQHGKPQLANLHDASFFSFSVAHSGDVVLVAIAGGEEVGIDIEWLTTRRDLKSIEAALAAYGPATLRDPKPGADRGWLQAWTRFEAVGKALGSGIATPTEEYRRAIAGRIAIVDLDLSPHYVAALALEAQQPRIQVRDFSTIAYGDSVGLGT